MKETFKKLDKDVVFIACSSDLQQIREELESMIRSVSNDFKNILRIEPYSWDTDAEEYEIDQKHSWQKNIPRPSDPKCHGVIVMMGERIGVPLESTFEPEKILSNYSSWANPDHEYKLLHPWPEKEKDRILAVKQGKFPLTGTVFEFLDAFSSDDTFARFTLMADKSVYPENRDEVKLNNFKWKKLQLEYADKTSKEELKRKRQIEDDYRQQREMVKNFLCAFSKNANTNQNAIADPKKVVDDYRKWLTEKIYKEQDYHVNPYNYLGYFDIGDGYNLYGREHQVERSVHKIENNFSSKGANALKITGWSGSGKSSFLRAGVLDFLESSKFRNKYRTVCFRPTDFSYQANHRIPKDIRKDLLRIIEKNVGFSLLNTDVDKVCKHKGNKWTINAINYLKKQLPEKSRLVIGIDQFEEIVDNLSDELYRPHWQPLIDFIDLASRNDAFAIAYTLENSRHSTFNQLIDKDIIPKSFSLHDEEPISGYEDGFLREIVIRPFEKKGFKISKEVYEKIKSNLQSLLDDKSHNAQSSFLPLIALMLSNLYDYVKQHIDPMPLSTEIKANKTFDTSVSGDGQQERGLVSLTPKIEELTRLDEIIKAQAKKAWEAVRAGVNPDFKALDHFLPPYVGLVESDTDKIQLLTVSYSDRYIDEQKLEESFKNHRLIVRTKGSGLRLVHEALIRFWKEAAEWFEKRKNYFRQELKFRTEARDWEKLGKPSDIQVDDKKIDFSTEVLNAYFRDWANPKNRLSEDDELLKQYAKLVFSKSIDPFKLGYSTGETMQPHACLAGSFGMIDLLDKFYNNNPDSLLVESEPTKTTPLSQASWHHAPAVQYLIDKRIKVEKTKGGWPLIAASIQINNREIFDILIDHTPLEGLAREDGYNMLHHSARYNQVEMAKDLINKGLDPTSIDNDGLTPLHWATRSGSSEAFDYFLSTCDLTCKTNDGSMILHLAAKYGQVDLVEKILEYHLYTKYFESLDDSGMTALHVAVNSLQTEAVKSLLDGLNVNAVRTKLVESYISTLLENPDVKKLTGIINLLNKEHGLSEIEFQQLQKQLKKEELGEIISFIKEKYEDLLTIEVKETPLHILVYKIGQSELDQEKFNSTLDILLQQSEIDPNVPDGNGETPLAIAHRNKDKKILKKLLRTQGKPYEANQRINKDGHTAVTVSYVIEDWEIFKHFEDKSSLFELESLDNNGNNVVHFLSEFTDPSKDLIKWVLSKSNYDQINSINIKGETPLIKAVKARRWDLVKIMAEQEIDPLKHGDNQKPVIFLLLESDVEKDIIQTILGLNKEQLQLIDYNRWNLLHRAFFYQKKDWIDLLKHENVFDELVALEDNCGWHPHNLITSKHREELQLEIDPPPLEEALNWDSNLRWTKLPSRQLESLTSKISDKDESLKVNNRTIVEKAHLPFYDPKKVSLIKIHSTGVIRYFFKTKNDLFALKGASPYIHEVNAKTPIVLNSQNVLDYLRFFCFFVRGEEGPFFIAESIDLNGIPKDFEESEKKDVEKYLRPAILTSINIAQGYYMAVAPVYYSNAIFYADFKILNSGMIDMMDDTLVVSDLSKVINIPIS